MFIHTYLLEINENNYLMRYDVFLHRQELDLFFLKKTAWLLFTYFFTFLQQTGDVFLPPCRLLLGHQTAFNN